MERCAGRPVGARDRHPVPVTPAYKEKRIAVWPGSCLIHSGTVKSRPGFTLVGRRQSERFQKLVIAVTHGRTL